MLIAYAERHGIPVVCEEVDDARALLDQIAREQPQTPFSLVKSAECLRPLLGKASGGTKER